MGQAFIGESFVWLFRIAELAIALTFESPGSTTSFLASPSLCTSCFRRQIQTKDEKTPQQGFTGAFIERDYFDYFLFM